VRFAENFGLTYLGQRPGVEVQMELAGNPPAYQLYRSLHLFFDLSQTQGVGYTLRDTLDGKNGRFILATQATDDRLGDCVYDIPRPLRNTVGTWLRLAKHFHLSADEIGVNTTKYFYLSERTTASNLFDVLFLLERLSLPWEIDFDLIYIEGQCAIMVA
jgi:hypothetical protein